ncbi:MAG: non-canonical purine NTP pyrophosphatase [Spirochaetales bacterium]|nr:non-canonical purine NTP pyrophosphatase [Spirochaetales bacterium]
MKLIYGTYNQSKIIAMASFLEGLPLTITGLPQDKNLTEPEESGLTPLENARIKALGYYKQIGQPVFSCDSGLYFDNVREEDQPGVFIKRLHRQDLSGKELMHYYSGLAARYGGKLTARYRNAICLIQGEKLIYSHDGMDIASVPFYLVEKPHSNFDPGFPLNSLSVEIASGKYYDDLGYRKNDTGPIKEGFRKFFLRTISA